MVPTMEEDGAVASIISLTLRREASLEYEPYWPGKGFSPHRRPGCTLSYICLQYTI
jgi:hypothetical protein